jgi:hypothetical protein
MIELGYELPDLDELLLWVSRNQIHTGNGYANGFNRVSLPLTTTKLERMRTFDIYFYLIGCINGRQ